MMKLIKLSDTHYIVVDDSEIKNCWFIQFTDNNKIKYCRGSFGADIVKTQFGKITHSTQPLEGVQTISLSEVEEAINGYSVEKLCDNFYKDYQQLPYAMEKGAWRQGFKAHQELVKDKLFTVKDMEQMFGLGAANHANGKPSFNEAIQPLLPKNRMGNNIR